MAVKRVDGRKTMSTANKLSAQVMAGPPPKRRRGLPARRKAAVSDLQRYSILVYAPPKFGKTTLLSTFPDIVFGTTEPGTKGLEIFEYNSEGGGVTDWNIMREFVEDLERGKRFSNVAVDTTDEAYAMCMAHVCKNAGVSHPHDANDYGKTWNKVSRGFTDMLNRIVRTGRGLYLTSHSREREIETAGGRKFTKIGPSLTGKAELTILSFADMIWYGEVVKGGRRVLFTEGDDLVTAGSRKRGIDKPLPPVILLPENEDDDYEHLAAAFRGEAEGAPPDVLWATDTASKAVKKLVDAARGEATEGGARA